MSTNSSDPGSARHSPLGLVRQPARAADRRRTRSAPRPRVHCVNAHRQRAWRCAPRHSDDRRMAPGARMRAGRRAGGGAGGAGNAWRRARAAAQRAGARTAVAGPDVPGALVRARRRAAAGRARPGDRRLPRRLRAVPHARDQGIEWPTGPTPRASRPAPARCGCRAARSRRPLRRATRTARSSGRTWSTRSAIENVRVIVEKLRPDGNRTPLRQASASFALPGPGTQRRRHGQRDQGRAATATCHRRRRHARTGSTR